MFRNHSVHSETQASCACRPDRPRLTGGVTASVSCMASQASVIGGGPQADHDGAESLSLFRLGTILLAHWRLFVALPLTFFLGAAVLSLAKPPRYTSASRFLPEGVQIASSDFSALIRQSGLRDMATASFGTRSPEFYVELLRSKELLSELAATRLPPVLAKPGRSVVADAVAMDVPDSVARRKAAVNVLGKRLATAIEAKTGIITLTTVDRTPEMALFLNVRLLELINEFDLRKRQSQARAEREFIQTRLAEARTELEAAEAASEQFLRQNRDYRGSPELSSVAARLQRRVELRQGVYTSLAQALEQARIEEARNTPRVTIVDNPQHSVRRLGAGTTLNAIGGFTLGVLLALGIAFGSAYVQRERVERPQEYDEFRSMSRELRAELIGRRQRPSTPGAR